MRFSIDKDTASVALRCDRFRDVSGNPFDFRIKIIQYPDDPRLENRFECWCKDLLDGYEFEFDKPMVHSGSRYIFSLPSELDSDEFVGNVWEFVRENFYVDEANNACYDLFVLILDMEQEDKLLVVVRLLLHRFLDGDGA